MEDQKWITTSAGVKMPKFIYGTAWKKERTADLVVKAVQAGFRGIDTACQPKHYNEPQVGLALKTLQKQGLERKDLYLQTKFTPLSGQDPLNVPYDKNAPIELQLAQSFESSKKNLQTDYVDSLVLHSPLSPHALLIKVWQAMEIIQKSGIAHQLGISNCYDIAVLKSLYKNASVKPAVLQNRFYEATGYDSELRLWCSGHGVIYQSFWTLTANPHILANEKVVSLAEKLDKTQAQILFRYLSQIGVVPLTGTTSGQHMSEDLDIFEFELSSEELQQLKPLFDKD